MGMVGIGSESIRKQLEWLEGCECHPLQVPLQENKNDAGWWLERLRDWIGS